MITPSLPIPGVSGCDVPAPPVDQFQIETTCVAENTNLYIIETNQAVTPPTVKIFDFAGTDVTGTVTPIVCPGAKHDVEESCYQDIADPFIKYTRANIYDVAVTPPVLSGTIWLDGAGAIVAAPANVEACEEMFAPQAIKLCDTLEAVISGDLAFTLAGNGVVVHTTGVLFANDSVRFFWTDFGNGFSDVGNHPSIQYFSDGNYEIKVYAVMASGNKLLVNAKEVVVTNGVAVLQGVNPQPVALNYNVAVGSVYQYFNSVGLPVGTPFNTDGTPYTVVGDLMFECPKIIDDLEDNAEYGGLGANIVECELTNTLNTVGEASDASIGAAASVVAGASPVTTFHPALDTTVNLTGNASSGVMGAGINVSIGTAVVGAVFTYNLDFISDTDPGDPADFGIVVWDNVAGTSVAATSIVTSLVSSLDAQGVGLNYPLYAIPNPIVNPYTIVWTGDLPVGDYSVLFVGQNQGVTDQVNLLIDYAVPAGVTGTSRALLTALDQCTIDALTPVAPVELPLTKTVQRLNIPYTVATNYKSASVTALSGDVTIDGEPVPQNFSWSVDSSHMERFADTVDVAGSDYIITEVR